MASKVLKARLALQREGNPHSGHNLKIRHDATTVILAICNNYPLPSPKEITTAIELPRGYKMVYVFGKKLQWRDFCLKDEVLAVYQGGTAPPVSLLAARQIAKDVSSGWLKEIVNQIYSVTQCDLDLIERFCSALAMEQLRPVA